jgi:hypothetical protein
LGVTNARKFADKLLNNRDSREARKGKESALPLGDNVRKIKGRLRRRTGRERKSAAPFRLSANSLSKGPAPGA